MAHTVVRHGITIRKRHPRKRGGVGRKKLGSQQQTGKKSGKGKPDILLWEEKSVCESLIFQSPPHTPMGKKRKQASTLFGNLVAGKWSRDDERGF